MDIRVNSASLAFALAGTLLGCTGPTPGYCKSTEDCEPGQFCHTDRNACEPRQDSGTAEAGGDSQRPDAPGTDMAADTGGDAEQTDAAQPDTLPPDTVKPDTGKPPKCGDKVKNQSWEVCDDKDLHGKSCKSLSYDGGTLKCAADCKSFITTGCYKCSDKKKNGAEECDGTDFGAATCMSKGFECGALKCTSGCKIDTSGCKNSSALNVGESVFTVDGLGNIYSAALTSSALEITKRNSKGTIAWSASSTSAPSDVEDIAVDSSGNVFVTGSYGGKVTFGLTTLTFKGDCGNEIYLVRVLNSGKFDWAESIGGPSSHCDYGKAVAVDSAGNAYLAGTFSGIVDIGASLGFTSTGTGQDVFLAKYDTKGTAKWAAAVTGGGPQDEVVDIAVDSAGNTYFAGVFTGTVKFSSYPTISRTSKGYKDLYVAKLDANGNYKWASAAGGSIDNDSPFALTVDSSGSCYVVGQYKSASFGSIQLVGSGGFIAKLATATGAFSWAKNAGGYASGVEVLKGNVPVVWGGYTGTTSMGSSSLTSAGGQDVYVARVNASTGQYVSAISGGGKGADSATSSAASVNGIYLSGTFVPPATFGKTTLTTGSKYTWNPRCFVP